ncbi:MAG: M1 family metallopeptidase [Candidatus Sabulitectum sp.]|nr:M1 family metallopeptidase [Candidatus Sabulitectum sp.]
MEIYLSPDSSTIRGSLDIAFSSGVHFPVDTLWLHLYPNAYSDPTTAFGQDLDAQGSFGFRRSDESDKGWIELSNWTMDGEPVTIHEDGTLGWIVLDHPLHGEDSVLLSGDFLVKVPKFWSRMGHHGDTYQITQWYPKMCVLDTRGWHRSRYHAAGEFYSDYGNYSVSIDVPYDFVTAATGRVLETEFNPDSTRRIDHWTAEGVHDFAWCSSPDYTVRDHVFNYPDSGGTVRVHMVLLDDDEDYWEDIPAAVDSTLAYYGEWYMPYPYNDLWVVDPVVSQGGGMEYPQFVFAFNEIPMTRTLEMVTIHEVGHQWFYGLLGNNETDEAWLDEGMNTFSELRYMERMHGFRGNMTTTPGWLLDISDRDLQVLSYVSAAHSDITPVLSRATDAGDGSYSTGYTYYTKPALFMSMLQVQLGEELFNEVMSTYFQRFALHHPHTEDFQAVVEELSGRSWQVEFDYWLRDTGSADVRLSALQTNEDSTTVMLTGDFPHGVLVPLIFVTDSDTLELLVDVFPGEETVVSVEGEWDQAVADPLMRLPDSAPWNNTLPVNFKLKPLILPIPQPDHYSVWALPLPGYADGSWRANAFFLVTPLPVEAGGPFTLSSHISIPFKEESSAAFGLSLSVPLSRSYGEEDILKTRFFSGYGLNRVSAAFSRNTHGLLAIDPRITTSFGIELFSVSDTTVYGGDNIQTGTSMEIQSRLGLSRRSFNRSFTAGINSFFDPGLGDNAYAGLSLDAEVNQRLSGGFVASTRANAEGVTENAPVQRMVRPAGGLFPENSLVDAVLSPDGVLSARNHYFVRTGPALPGYWNRFLRGKVGFSLEQRLSLIKIPIGIFAGTGWVGSSFEELTNGTLLSNAGILVNVAVVEAIFPLWVSDPEEGEENWEFRWRIRILF